MIAWTSQNEIVERFERQGAIHQTRFRYHSRPENFDYSKKSKTMININNYKFIKLPEKKSVFFFCKVPSLPVHTIVEAQLILRCLKCQHILVYTRDELWRRSQPCTSSSSFLTQVWRFDGVLFVARLFRFVISTSHDREAPQFDPKIHLNSPRP